MGEKEKIELHLAQDRYLNQISEADDALESKSKMLLDITMKLDQNEQEVDANYLKLQDQIAQNEILGKKTESLGVERDELKLERSSLYKDIAHLKADLQSLKSQFDELTIERQERIDQIETHEKT